MLPGRLSQVSGGLVGRVSQVSGGLVGRVAQVWTVLVGTVLHGWLAGLDCEAPPGPAGGRLARAGAVWGHSLISG